MNRREFLQRCVQSGAAGFLVGVSGAQAGSLLGHDSAQCQLGPQPDNPFPQLNKIGDHFSFALVADPQVTTAEEIGSVGGTSAVRYQQLIHDVNALPQRPAFAIIDGDLVNTPTSTVSWDVFMERTLQFKPLPILVYGNHDGNADTNHYAVFQDMQETCNGTRLYTFSFDCGQWHFVSIPCDIPTAAEEQAILDWLDADLKANRNRPTMVFEHEHLMPQGLTQLEWYTYDRPYRMAVLDALARYGNVRYVICGHVHNGIKASVKTTWTYRGINFITAPTCTASRPFGEEYTQFAAGEDQENGDSGGGFYMLFEISGKDCVVKGRLANVPDEYIYADTFRPYQDEEPFWFQDLFAYAPAAALTNGSFESDLNGWSMPYRYVADVDPMFYWQISDQRAHQGGKSLYLQVHEAGQPWAQTEMLEFRQWVLCPSDPTLGLAYYLNQAGIGGGAYLRIFAFNGSTLKHTFLLDWNAPASAKREADNMGKNSYYYAWNNRGTPTTFISEGLLQRAMFWTLPDNLNTWHELQLNMKQVYDAAMGAGRWNSLGVNRLFIAIGVWSNENDGSRNGCWFDDVSLAAAPGVTSNVNGVPLAIDSSVWYTDFGRNFL